MGHIFKEVSDFTGRPYYYGTKKSNAEIHQLFNCSNNQISTLERKGIATLYAQYQPWLLTKTQERKIATCKIKYIRTAIKTTKQPKKWGHPIIRRSNIVCWLLKRQNNWVRTSNQNVACKATAIEDHITEHGRDQGADGSAISETLDRECREGVVGWQNWK